MTKSKCFKCLKIFVYFIFLTLVLSMLTQCQDDEDININITVQKEKYNPRIKFKSLIEDQDNIGKSNSELLGNPE